MVRYRFSLKCLQKCEVQLFVPVSNIGVLTQITELCFRILAVNSYFIEILYRVFQDKQIIEHNRTKLYTLQQDCKQVSKQNQNRTCSQHG